MKKPRYLFWIFVSEAVGLASGLLSRQGIANYSALVEKPALTPPGWLFPVVWTVLYALMGIGVARVEATPQSRFRQWGMNVFVAQLMVNFFWSLLFFNAQAYGFSFLWILLLLGLIFTMILLFYQVDKTAALMQLPYLLWVSFAAYLNWGVWMLNRS